MHHVGSVFYDSDYSIRRPISSIRQLCHDLKCCLDRISKGYCVKDLWEIDTWFLGIMPEMLEEFNHHKNSYPNTFFEQMRSKARKRASRVPGEISYFRRTGFPGTLQKNKYRS